MADLQSGLLNDKSALKAAAWLLSAVSEGTNTKIYTTSIIRYTYAFGVNGILVPDFRCNQSGFINERHFGMEASYFSYDYIKSVERIDEILDGADASYEDRKGIPSRASLTFTNGFYVDVTVLFVDIRGSKELATKHTRPVLAKIYRAYISEVVAVLKGNSLISEIYIEGDGVWAVFDTTTKAGIDSVFNTAASVASLVDILNLKLSKKGYSNIKVGIGLDYGESLYIKAGYKGSGINEVVWIGKVVGSCACLSGNGNKTWTDKRMMVSSNIYNNLNDSNKKLLKWNSGRNCYHGNIINIAMNEWEMKNG